MDRLEHVLDTLRGHDERPIVARVVSLWETSNAWLVHDPDGAEARAYAADLARDALAVLAGAGGVPIDVDAALDRLGQDGSPVRRGGNGHRPGGYVRGPDEPTLLPRGANGRAAARIEDADTDPIDYRNADTDPIDYNDLPDTDPTGLPPPIPFDDLISGPEWRLDP